MMSIYIPSKMELNWTFNMRNATLKWFCPNCGCTALLHLLVCSSQKSLLGSHKMTWWHFDSFFMMDHFFTFVTKHENVEFRELMDEKNPSHCIRIILKDSRKVFFSACLTTLYTISLEEMKSNYISSFSLIKVTRLYRFGRPAQDTKMSN